MDSSMYNRCRRLANPALRPFNRHLDYFFFQRALRHLNFSSSTEHLEIVK
jgi:hypothetical protein